MGKGKTARRPLGRGKPYPYIALLPALLIFLILPAFLHSQSLSLSQLANSQYESGRFDTALVTYGQIITENPGKKEGYYNRGLCYFRLNRLDEAQHDFATCLQIDSVFNDARFMEIITLQKKNEWNSSYIEFKRLNTTYAGYNELKKRIQYHQLSVSISRNWYYMVAIMFLFIILIAVVAKSYTVRKGY